MDIANASTELDGLFTQLSQYQDGISRTEDLLREQRSDFSRMLGELQETHIAVWDRFSAEMETLRQENDQFRAEAAEHQAHHEMASPGRKGNLVEPLLRENDDLRRAVDERDVLIQELRNECQLRQEHASPEEADTEAYEAELNQFRRQLEADRQSLNEEVTQLRARNVELNDAVREAELEMSRERAQLARERVQLERLREEIRQELEYAQRSAGVQERLAPVQRLKEELAERKRAADSGSAAGLPAGQPRSSPGSRWRNFLGRGENER